MQSKNNFFCNCVYELKMINFDCQNETLAEEMFDVGSEGGRLVAVRFNSLASFFPSNLIKYSH